MSDIMEHLIGKSLVSRKQNKVYIPKKVMDEIGVEDGDYLGFFKVGNNVIIKKMELVVADGK